MKEVGTPKEGKHLKFHVGLLRVHCKSETTVFAREEPVIRNFLRFLFP